MENQPPSILERRGPSSDLVLLERRVKSSANWIASKWFLWIMLFLGIWVILPWLAPWMMRAGWERPAQAIYALYSFQCHQLPQRSFFLFGPNFMYSLEEIQVLWKNTTDPTVMRQFIGDPEIGYKVAWSDRMVSAYTSLPLAAAIWWPLRRRFRPLPLWGFILLALPMVADGLSHMISDFSGVDQGFRYANEWLATLTGNALPEAFYAGTTLGSFNSLMRLITGMLFGFGAVWFTLPTLWLGMQASRRRARLQSARLSDN